MAFVTPEYVKNLQETHEAKFWKVYDSSGKVMINKLDHDIGMSKSTAMLQETLDNCQADYVTVRLFTIAPAKTTAGAGHDVGLTLKVRLDSMQTQKPFQASIGMAPGIQEYLALHDKIRQVELEKMRMELESNQADSPWMRLGEKLLQNDALVMAITGAISKLAAGKQQPVQRIAQAQTTTAPGTISETLERLAKVDPDYLETLERMTSYLEKNPGVIDQIKPIFNA
jgi:hypothetical protein